MDAWIRDYRAGDEAAAAWICLKTGDHGADGEHLFPQDPDALSRIYTTPYLRLSPELALMLEDAEGVCGYALATLDSRDFFDRYERECRPQLCAAFPEPQGDRAGWSAEEEVHYLYHHPDYFCPEPYAAFPSHLHIDLLTRAQGRGYGRQLIAELLRRLRQQGRPGVHLGMSERNTAAYGFYRRLGFDELTRVDDAIYMGMRLGPDVPSGDG